MKLQDLSRRDIAALTAAAFGGLMAGTTLSGCNQPSGASTTGDSPAPSGSTAAAVAKQTDLHACKGLNGCKGKGAGGMNACAGQGGCASMSAHHGCKGHNDCNGQGGGETAGMNACKGQGGCAVPVTDGDAWKKARAAFEEKMKAEGKTVGQAPA